MNLERVEEIAKAVLYEGYMLYPYRPSSVKNQQRWNFGVLCPPSYCDQNPGSESSYLQTQCLLRMNASTRLTARVRFLHVCQRCVARVRGAGAELATCLEFVDRLELDGRVYQPWLEATERTLTYDGLDAVSLSAPRSIEFAYPEETSFEFLEDAEGRHAGALMRRWRAVYGTLHLRVERCGEDVARLTARVENRSNFSPCAPGQPGARDEALLSALVSAHVIFGVEQGEFLSLIDPPVGCEDLARGCEITGAWPVLAGDDATTLLASPIILYDYPQIAPESAGDLFDATEIDEILSLRILTLTDEEKREMRQSDDRTRELLDRTESIPDEHFMKLHGVLRGMAVLKETGE